LLGFLTNYIKKRVAEHHQKGFIEELSAKKPDNQIFQNMIERASQVRKFIYGPHILAQIMIYNCQKLVTISSSSRYLNEPASVAGLAIRFS